jgi:diguanylate cyclase (GGDEF)-like protein
VNATPALTEIAPAPTDQGSLRILLVDDLATATQTRATLACASPHGVAVTHAERVEDALALLDQQEFDVLLLDLSVPDTQGLETLDHIRTRCPALPVVVLTARDDEATAIRALRRGAQDHVVKGQADCKRLLRVVRYAIERHRAQGELAVVAITDELTGLLNRRGFKVLAQHHLHLARRECRAFGLFLADMDHLKQINDTLGHLHGDRAIADAAELLRATFRRSDIVARLGGDEFVVLTIQATAADLEAISERLRERLRQLDDERARPYRLSMSFGMVTIEPDETTSVDLLVERADELLYEQKRRGCRTAAAP